MFSHKMAAKTSRNEITSLSPYVQAVYCIDIKTFLVLLSHFFLKFYLLATFFILKNCQIYAACNCLKFNKSNFENRQRRVFFSESVNVNCHTIGHCVREDGRQSVMAMSFS